MILAVEVTRLTFLRKLTASQSLVTSTAALITGAPDKSKIVYDESTDPMLHSFQLRGNVGDDYSDEDAVVLETRNPGDAREFVTGFGLNQPGAKIALKVYVILTTGNEAGSAALFVQRPANVQSLAA